MIYLARNNIKSILKINDNSIFIIINNILLFISSEFLPKLKTINFRNLQRQLNQLLIVLDNLLLLKLLMG